MVRDELADQPIPTFDVQEGASKLLEEGLDFDNREEFDRYMHLLEGHFYSAHTPKGTRTNPQASQSNLHCSLCKESPRSRSTLCRSLNSITRSTH